MRIDPQVSRRKFDAEVQRLWNCLDILEARGCSLDSVAFPYIDVAFQLAPVQMVAIPVPANVQVRVNAAGADINCVSRPFLARIALDDYDVLPPSVTFLEPGTKRPLRTNEVPHARVHANGQLILIEEPTKKRPMLCLPGIREYHAHPQHESDDWFRYRNDVNAFTVVEWIWRTCVHNLRPTIFVHQGRRIAASWEFAGDV